MNIFNHINRYFQLRSEAQLLLKIVQPRVIQMSFDFNSNIEKSEIVWAFYNLKSNYKKEAYWKRGGFTLSANEISVKRLLKFYSENIKEFVTNDNLQDLRFMNRMIHKYSRFQDEIISYAQHERISF